MHIQRRHLRDLGAGDVAVEGWDAAVVIDVIRAFTVAPWILRQGAARLLLAPDAEAAVSASREWPDALLLKDGSPDPRFALPNAPGRIARESLADRTVIQATGNGTRGAHAVRAIPTVFCASFATASATVRALQRSRSVLLVPTEGDEDVALADFVTACLTTGAPDPTPFLRRVESSDAGRECLARGSDPAYPGVDPDDLRRCLELDTFSRALVAAPCGGLLEVRPR